MEQLQSFSKRLSRFHITIHSFNRDAGALSPLVSGTSSRSVTGPLRFDRIDVSNIIDFNYLGIPRVLESWGPLLTATSFATIIGYSMNWPLRHPGASPKEGEVSKLTGQLVADGRVCL